MIRVGGRINISWVLLVMAIMHHRLYGHPIGLLGVWGIIWSSWLGRDHLLISNWLVFDRWVRRWTVGFRCRGLGLLCWAKGKE